MEKKGLTQANTLRSNNTTSTGYGIVYADEIIGGRSVETKEDLNNLPAWVLGKDNKLEEGTTYYVENERCFYIYTGSEWKQSFKAIGLPVKSWYAYNDNVTETTATSQILDISKIINGDDLYIGTRGGIEEKPHPFTTIVVYNDEVNKVPIAYITLFESSDPDSPENNTIVASAKVFGVMTKNTFPRTPDFNNINYYEGSCRPLDTGSRITTWRLIGGNSIINKVLELNNISFTGNTIKTSEIDFTATALQKFNNSISDTSHNICAQYSVVDATHNNIVGQMLLIGDSMGHMVTEILTTSATLKDGVINWNEHSDTVVNTYIRRNHVKEGGNSSIAVGSWSKWTYYSGEGQFNDFKILVAQELNKKVNTSDIVQQTGDSTTSVMSQKAVSTKLSDLKEEATKINAELGKKADKTAVEAETKRAQSAEEVLNGKIDAQKNEINVAKEEALQAISENEQSAITNFNSQRVTPEMLSESTKQLIEASGGGTITNLADDEDLTSVDDGTGSNVLKFKDRIYNKDNNTGLGYHILRKKEVNNGFNCNENTIYEIRYDLDFNGKELVLKKNSKLIYNGGTLNNVKINSYFSYYNSNIDKRVLGRNCSFISFFVPDISEDDIIYFNVSNLPFGESLSCTNSGSENSRILNNFLSNSYISYLIKYRTIMIDFSIDHNSEIKGNFFPTYTFSDTINILSYGRGKKIIIRLGANISFDRKGCVVPTKEELTSSIENISKNYYGLYINGFHEVDIQGIGYRSGEFDKIKKVCIDGGAKTDGTINYDGHYYEGIESNNGIRYYSSFSDTPLLIKTCDVVKISNIEIKNSFMGLSVDAISTHIDDVYVHDIYGDNGISVSTYTSPTLDNFEVNHPFKGGIILTNCVATDCEDLGMSVNSSENVLFINCKSLRCGNDNLNSNGNINENFGVDSSFNAGGGFSVEPTLSSYGDKLYNKVTFINCEANDCYNYGIALDNASNSINVINCRFNNIIGTYKSKYGTLKGFRYMATSIRKGAAIEATSIVQKDNAKVVCLGCEFNNVSYVTNHNCNFIAIGCVANNIIGSDEYSFDNKFNNIYIGGIYKGDKDKENFTFIADIDKSCKGISINRPSLQDYDAGFEYFDTTLKKPIWWTGTEWVDSNGVSV